LRRLKPLALVTLTANDSKHMVAGLARTSNVKITTPGLLIILHFHERIVAAATADANEAAWAAIT
jgi:hypothetical protein